LRTVREIMKLFCVVTALLAVATADGPGGHHHGAHHGAHHAAAHGDHGQAAHHGPHKQAAHHGPHIQAAHPKHPLQRLPVRRRPQVNKKPFIRNPFLSQQFRLPHNPRPVRNLKNNLPVRPPQHVPHVQHHQHQQPRPNINTIPQAPIKKPVVLTSGKTLKAELEGNEHFSTLFTALKAADLLETLDGAGPFTLFAPTNSAFDKVPVDSLNKLLEDKKALKAVLLRHVVPGTKLAGKAIPQGATKLRTASGEELNAKRGKFVQITSSAGSAFVVKFDFVASNGVYHAVDQVL